MIMTMTFQKLNKIGPLLFKPKNIQNSKKLAKQMRKEGANFQHHQQRRHCFGQTEQAHIGILFEK